MRLAFSTRTCSLEDVALLGEVERMLREQRMAVDVAFYRVMTGTSRRWRPSRTIPARRAIDVEDVAQRVLRNLHALEEEDDGQSGPDCPHMLVTKDLSPSDTASMDRELVRGFVTELGSQTSHTAILARSLGIPAVVGLEDITTELDSGADVLLDGYLGLVILNRRWKRCAPMNGWRRGGDIRTDLLGLRDQPARPATANGSSWRPILSFSARCQF